FPNGGQFESPPCYYLARPAERFHSQDLFHAAHGFDVLGDYLVGRLGRSRCRQQRQPEHSQKEFMHSCLLFKTMDLTNDVSFYRLNKDSSGQSASLSICFTVPFLECGNSRGGRTAPLFSFVPGWLHLLAILKSFRPSRPPLR